GCNGAGNTTLLRMMAGGIAPQSGSCTVYGSDPGCDVPSQRGKTFFVEDNMEFPGKCIHDFAKMHSRFYPTFSPKLLNENLKAFGLSGFEPMKNLSYGNKKKTQIAYALALGVDLLLLDEPTNGLDIESKAILKSLLARSMRDNQTIIVATHTVYDLDSLFEGALMMQGSNLLFSGLEEDVVSRLAFPITSTPHPQAIYSETNLGRYLNITEAEDEETKVDWRLLYSALHSPKRDEILTILNSNSSLEDD
ncbi:MAG: ATP-binding cassette domain-containing protein, partial [Muribaculaceae bacterium]|nr:ATP-binding cassette domain-containing protein [Muribaculaceae bacterium]